MHTGCETATDTAVNILILIELQEAALQLGHCFELSLKINEEKIQNVLSTS